ncbi:hypothetical protein TTHERM_00657330 (macronuclear) [Tetrahymena thermophila SB210]|uniref:Uncharacterized protein n=1 Tax=Tetrahymena thermophila (strain SB210) TaxID=312017 RepID=I7MM16_TETTS|nr:hypothetical protein TTHERM_00657330 [Tetrahymena thermophila SB210]EAS03788.2 hypothetical protein TTHERM_00657330 [Tetrahymena thermophila SB210]|eukprot:XP_001024033.2 hypothetical protein TTHERM_00657330 [Tetrahymena thermophila SB210]
MEQTSTTSSTPTMQPDQFASNTKLQMPYFMNTELISQMRNTSSQQNLPTVSNFASNSRTQNQLISSSSLNNQNGSSTSIANCTSLPVQSQNSINLQLNTQVSQNPTNQNMLVNNLASPNTLANSNSNNNGTNSPTKNLLVNMNNGTNQQTPLQFLNNNNFLQFQIQQLQNQQQLNAALNQQNNLIGLPIQNVQQNQNPQQQFMLLNMMENIQQQQQLQQMEQFNNLSNLHLMAAQLQSLPSIKIPSCQKHQHKAEPGLKFLCTSPNCSYQWQLLCQNCLIEHTGHEIIDARVFLNQVKGKVTENIAATSNQFNTIENLFNQNIQSLEGMQEHINNLLDTLKSLQRAYFMMKLTSNNDTTYLINVLKEIEEPSSCLNEKQLNERISSISKISQNIRQVKMESFSQLISINNMSAKVVNDAKQQIINTQGLAANLQETFSHRMIGSEMKELEKKHQEEKTLEHFSKLFHLIKGHAKKRDVINFLTWEPQTKELKYSKDIKDKHGEHFYVSFSLKLKNIENMENKDIDENFINKIVKVVEEKAPEIQNKKNVERKKIDPNGKKRKYCRFNPRIEIDVSLNCSAYKNIKIE